MSLSISASVASLNPQQHFLPAAALKGTIRTPGDKSISHRALMFAALAIDESRISGLLEGEDVLATADAMRAMGATIDRSEDGIWHVHGVGVGGLLQPDRALDMGNSGTSARLLCGLIASHDLEVTMIGDASLSKRPMRRVTDPLSQIGANFQTSPGGTLPMRIEGISPAIPIEYRLPIASAQVKSAVLLAGLNIAGRTRLIEPIATRDHSERMLKGFGADITIETDQDGARHIAVNGPCELRAQQITVPGDPSSAAFFIVAALIVPGSDVLIENVGLNPTRTGLITLLRQMGGSIEELDKRKIGGELLADLRVRHSPLVAISVDPELIPAMVDEFPIFFIAAALAKGVTRTSGLGELRVKESDRLALMARGLSALGVKLIEHQDGLEIEGRDGASFVPSDGANSAPPLIETALDHRIAMSFAIAGLMAKGGVIVNNVRPIATSFPDFMELLNGLQAE